MPVKVQSDTGVGVGKQRSWDGDGDGNMAVAMALRPISANASESQPRHELPLAGRVDHRLGLDAHHAEVRDAQLETVGAGVKDLVGRNRQALGVLKMRTRPRVSPAFA